MKPGALFSPSQFSGLSPKFVSVSLACGLCLLAACKPEAAPSQPAASADTPASSASATASAPAASSASNSAPKAAAAAAPLPTGPVDLSTFPLAEGAETPRQRTLATLAYRAKASIPAVYSLAKKQLLSQSWKELSEGTSVSDEYGSSTFERSGHRVSLMLMPAGEAGMVDVVLKNHGNVDFGKLPLPKDVKTTYAGPMTAMYTSEAPTAAVAEECRNLLLNAGWEPYGSAGDTANYKRENVMLLVTTQSAPAQGGKTMISLQSELMSADIPAPRDAEEIRYSDLTQRLDFDTPAGQDKVVAFYREALAKTGWTTKMEKTVNIDDKEVLVFRHPNGGMIDLSMAATLAGDKTRVILEHKTGAEVAEEDRKAKAQGEALKKKLAEEKNMPKPKLLVTLPAGASDVKQKENEITFTTRPGYAKSAAEALRKQFTDAGWQENVAVLDALAGSVSLAKDSLSLTITYSDTGFTPAEVSITSIGTAIEQGN